MRSTCVRNCSVSGSCSLQSCKLGEVCSVFESRMLDLKGVSSHCRAIYTVSVGRLHDCSLVCACVDKLEKVKQPEYRERQRVSSSHHRSPYRLESVAPTTMNNSQDSWVPSDGTASAPNKTMPANFEPRY